MQHGQLVQDLRIVGVLGEGATAIVYLVEDTRDNDTRRALKLLSVLGASYRKRLRREAAAAGLVHQDNVVGIVELVDHDGYQGVLMEYVEGPTLYHWLQAHMPTIDEALALAVGMLRGVQALHQAGLVHRDLKPSNVMLGTDASGGIVPKLVDFGLIKDTDLRDRMTVTGVAMGTPTYMAPEQLRDASRVDERADLYSLGCMLFEMLTGRPPFQRDDWWGTYRAVEQGTRADLSPLSDGLPAGVRDLIGAMLEPEPDDRPQTAAEILELLARHLGEHDPALSGRMGSGSEGAAAVRDLVQARESALSRTELWRDGPLTSSGLHLPTGNVEQLTSSFEDPTVVPAPQRRWIPMAIVAVAAVVAVALMAWALLRPGLGPTPALTSSTEVASIKVPRTAQDPPPPSPIEAEAQDDEPTEADAESTPSPDPRTAAQPDPSRSTADAPDDTAEDGTAEGTADDEDTDGPPPPEPGVAIVTGDVAEVVFIGSEGQRARVGEPLDPGRWSLQVRWTAGSGLVDGGSFEVDEGETVTVACDPGFYSCEVR